MTQEWKCCMGVLLRKSTFWPELTQILNLEETETHYGKSIIMAHYFSNSNEGIWSQKIIQIPISMHGVKSSKLSISATILVLCPIVHCVGSIWVQNQNYWSKPDLWWRSGIWQNSLFSRRFGRYSFYTLKLVLSFMLFCSMLLHLLL